jgi:hypothetical protein
MRIWLVIALMVLVGIANLQYDAISWGQAKEAIRAEARADAYALQEDTTTLRLRMAVAPLWMRSQWQETQASIESLGADAHADARMGETAVKSVARQIAPPKDEQ